MTRKLSSFIDGFQLYTEKANSPELFRKWGGIFTVAAGLERRVYIKTARGVLYPNLYTILVGPPGAAKTLVTVTARELLSNIEAFHVASSSVTRASLIDELKVSERKIILPKMEVMTFNSLTIISNEFGVFLESYDQSFMNTLTDIYDGWPYKESRRGKDLRIRIDHPQLNILAATTPSYLNALLPPGAWDQGFMSRVIMVYAGPNPPDDLFAIPKDDIVLKRNLETDMVKISSMVGEMRFHQDAAEAINLWSKSGGDPKPLHPRLTHYNTRRTAQLLKLCIIASAAENDNLEITLENYVEALNWLTETEAVMEDIFRSMSSGGDGEILKECWHFIYSLYIKKTQPVPLFKVIGFLQDKTPAHNIQRMIEILEKTNSVKRVLDDKMQVAFIPKQPTHMD